MYPLYLVGTVIGVAVPATGLLLGMSHWWTWPTLIAAALPALVMLPTPPLATPSAFYAFNSPAWSLFFEVAVNLLYAMLAGVSRRVAGFAIGGAALGVVAAAVSRGSLDAGWLRRGPARRGVSARAFLRSGRAASPRHAAGGAFVATAPARFRNNKLLSRTAATAYVLGGKVAPPAFGRCPSSQGRATMRGRQGKIE